MMVQTGLMDASSMLEGTRMIGHMMSGRRRIAPPFHGMRQRSSTAEQRRSVTSVGTLRHVRHLDINKQCQQSSCWDRRLTYTHLTSLVQQPVRCSLNLAMFSANTLNKTAITAGLQPYTHSAYTVLGDCILVSVCCYSWLLYFCNLTAMCFQIKSNLRNFSTPPPELWGTCYRRLNIQNTQ